MHFLEARICQYHAASIRWKHVLLLLAMLDCTCIHSKSYISLAEQIAMKGSIAILDSPKADFFMLKHMHLQASVL